MRYPEFLKENGTIGFVAPSFGCATEPYSTRFASTKSKFQEMGYQLEEGPNCQEMCGIGISNTPELCAEELQEYYCHDSNDVLISCGGGELMCEILSYLDFERIAKADPKWYLGYSDNTNFTFLQTTLCDTAAIYGPCAGSFGMEKWHPALSNTFGLLTGEKFQDGKITLTGYDKWERYEAEEPGPLDSYQDTEPSVLHLYQGRSDSYEAGQVQEKQLKMQGRLVGGCLDCLTVLCGTKYDRVSQFAEKYKNDGIIWFLEACDLNVMAIRRAMWELEQAGWFHHTSGFIIGRPLHFDEPMMGLDQYKAVYDVISHYEVPILMDADLGHLPPVVPLISGAYATVQATSEAWEITMELK